MVNDITELTQSLAAQGPVGTAATSRSTFRPLGPHSAGPPGSWRHALPEDVTDADPPVTIGRVAIFYQ